MARTWWSIEVQLVSGRGEYLWPRPGRVLIAQPSWSFSLLAQGINEAFARWDLSPTHHFTLADGTRVAMPDHLADDAADGTRTTLSRLAPGEVFAYTFDVGHAWDHVCTVAALEVDPLEVTGLVPDRPLPVFGWGSVPDQHGRRFALDDGEEPPPPPDPPASDLPPVLAGWGPGDGPHRPLTPDAITTGTMSAPEGWDETAVRALRAALYAGDLDATAALLRRHGAGEVAHLAAPALLDLARRGDQDITAGVIQHLTGRAWPGDAELATELGAAAGEGPPPAAVPIPVDLGLVAEQLERHGHDDLSPLYLDVITGGWVSSEPMAGVEDPPTDLDDDERYLPLVPYGRDEGWHDMALFIQSVQDPQLAERLQRAIQGRGAFRYFADVVHHDDVEWRRWRRFSEERHLGRAREWLSLRDYRPDH